MSTTKELEHSEPAGPKRTGLSIVKKRIALAVCALLVALLSVAVWKWRAGDVNSVLSSEGFARLPESARDVMIDRAGGVLDVQVTFIRFTASQDEILAFLRSSGIYTGGGPAGSGWSSGRAVIVKKGVAARLKSFLQRVLRSGPQTIANPAWWVKDLRNPGLLQYRPEPPDYDFGRSRPVIGDWVPRAADIESLLQNPPGPDHAGQTVMVDWITNTVYIQLL